MHKIVSVAAAALLLLSAAGCSADTRTSPEPIKASESATPTPTPTPAAEAGSRSNPLAIGSQAKYSSDSMWIIGASSATTQHQGYITLPLHLSLDWDACRALNGDVCDEGVDPSGSLMIEYVAADGSSYTAADDPSIDWGSVPKAIYEVGTVYPPLADVETTSFISVPADKIAGGVWHISSAVTAGNSVWVASGL